MRTHWSWVTRALLVCAAIVVSACYNESSVGPSARRGVAFDFFSIYSTDFSAGAGPEWSNQTTTTSPSSEKFLGEFGNDSVSLSLTGIQPHAQLRVTADLYIIRSWDGPEPTWGGPDQFRLWGDGTQLATTTFGANTQVQDFPCKPSIACFAGTPPFPSNFGATTTNALGYTYWSDVVPVDAEYRGLSFTINHTASTFLLSFVASGLQDISDESWGVDNIIVEIDGAGASLNVLTQPSGAVNATAFIGQPVVQILDNGAHVITTGGASTLTVTASIQSGTGTLTGTTSVAAVAGVATFTDLAIVGTGAHTLHFATSSPALSVNSSSFTVAPGFVLNVGASATASGTVGNDLVIPLQVDCTNRGTLNIASLAATITWDPTKFTYINSAAGTWLDDSSNQPAVILNTTLVSSGSLGITMFSTGENTNTFTFGTVTLRPIVTGTNGVSATVTASGNVTAQTVPLAPRNLSVTSN